MHGFFGFIQLTKGKKISIYPWLTPQFYSDIYRALLDRAYDSLEWGLNNPPRPHSFVSLPVQSNWKFIAFHLWRSIRFALIANFIIYFPTVIDFILPITDGFHLFNFYLFDITFTSVHINGHICWDVTYHLNTQNPYAIPGGYSHYGITKRVPSCIPDLALVFKPYCGEFSVFKPSTIYCQLFPDNISAMTKILLVTPKAGGTIPQIIDDLRSYTTTVHYTNWKVILATSFLFTLWPLLNALCALNVQQLLVS